MKSKVGLFMMVVRPVMMKGSNLIQRKQCKIKHHRDEILKEKTFEQFKKEYKNQDIKQSNIQYIYRCTKNRRKYWKGYIQRMGDNILVKQAKTQNPEETRP